MEPYRSADTLHTGDSDMGILSKAAAVSTLGTSTIVAKGLEAHRHATGGMQVVTYKKPKDFEKDYDKRVAAGWRIQGQELNAGRVTVTRLLTTGILAFGHKKGAGTTVTWVRDTE